MYTAENTDSQPLLSCVAGPLLRTQPQSSGHAEQVSTLARGVTRAPLNLSSDLELEEPVLPNLPGQHLPTVTGTDLLEPQCESPGWYCTVNGVQAGGIMAELVKY